MSVRFTQSCPTCGRRVQIRASLLGYNVACQHCNAEFIADANEHFPGPNNGLESPALDPLMARVEEALERAAKHPTAIT